MKDKYSIILLCKICEVSKAGYYKFINKTDKDENKDISTIKSIQEKHKYRIGVYRMVAYIKRDYGIIMNHKKVYRLMKENDLLSKIKRKSKYYGKKENNPKNNKINRNFNTSCPFDKIATDTSEFAKSGKKIYLSPIKDLHTKVIEACEIGYSPSLTLAMNTIKQIKDKSIPEGTLFHSDQGVLYNNKQFQKFLEDNNFIQSMSRKGNPIDNSPMESFFSTVKSEVVYNDYIKILNDKNMIEELEEYIRYYNYDRIQKSLGYLTPIEYKEKHFKDSATLEAE